MGQLRTVKSVGPLYVRPHESTFVLRIYNGICIGVQRICGATIAITGKGSMFRISAFLIANLLLPVTYAQDPTVTDGDKYKLVFENECVRVLDYKDQSGEKTNQHRHSAFVLYALSTFQRSVTLPDGKVLKRQFKPGDVMWSDSQTHIGENTGQTPTHVILVEMKSQIGACAAR